MWSAEISDFFCLFPGVLFLYSLKTALRFSDASRGYKKGKLGSNGLKEISETGKEGFCFSTSFNVLKI